jgi:hypothetical protein
MLGLLSNLNFAGEKLKKKKKNNVPRNMTLWVSAVSKHGVA